MTDTTEAPRNLKAQLREVKDAVAKQAPSTQAALAGRFCFRIDDEGQSQ